MLSIGENVSLGSTRPYGGEGYQTLSNGGIKQHMVTAGLLTANVKVSSAGMQHRADFADKNNYIIGMPGVSAALGFGADPRGNVNIRPFDLLITYKEVPRSELSRYSHGQNLAQFRPPTFSSFTGMDTGINKLANSPPAGASPAVRYNHQELLRQMLEDKLVKIGFAADWYTFQEATQKDSGLAAIVAGSFSTLHTGTNVIMPGQLVQWRAPPMVDEYMQEYVRVRRTSPGYASQMQDGRFPALLEPFEPRSSTHAIVQRAAKLLAGAFTQQDALRNIFAGKVGGDALNVAGKLDAQSNAIADLVIGMTPPAPAGEDQVSWFLGTLNTLANDPIRGGAERVRMYKVVEALGELYHLTSEKIVGRSMGLAWPAQQLKITV